MNRTQYLLALSLATATLAAALYGVNRLDRRAAAHSTVRLDYARPVEPLFVESAVPAPPPRVERPATRAYCLPKPGIAGGAYPCQFDGGEVSL